LFFKKTLASSLGSDFMSFKIVSWKHSLFLLVSITRTERNLLFLKGKKGNLGEDYRSNSPVAMLKAGPHGTAPQHTNTPQITAN